jgi:hypothetical protein
MAIFARLVLMLFGIVFSAVIGGTLGQVNGWDADSRQQYAIGGAVIGAVAGMFIGRTLGNMVVGEPPKD